MQDDQHNCGWVGRPARPVVQALVRAPVQLALALLPILSACGTPTEPGPASESESEAEAEAELADPHAEAKARLAAWEQQQRESVELGALPASDQRLGADPYRIIALPSGQFAASLRGADRVVLLDARGEVTHTAAAPHDPTDLIWRGDELLVVGTGEARVARYDGALEPRGEYLLPDAYAPRVIAAGDSHLWVADEGGPMLHELDVGADGDGAVVTRPYCHGPIALERLDDLLIGNCVLEHRLRVDRIGDDGSLTETELGGPQHDGPIWSFAIGPEHDGVRWLALTGIEDHPLVRRDGAFGYIDSFLWLVAMGRDDDGRPSFERRASINLSELGVVTPKWARWRPGAAGLIVGGYASAPILTLDWTAGFEAAPQLGERPGLPGTRDAVWLDDHTLLATDPLLDRLLVLDEAGVRELDPAPELPDDRSFDERLGEALLFTTAMAPRNSAIEQHSRFSCEACHFEGRGDGRVHFTGREHDGVKVHAVSKTLMGLFPNRPHFSRALDRSTAQMVDNEFRVANRHSELDPWFSLSEELVPWITALPGWPGAARDGEALRSAVMAFLLRYTAPANPATRGRSEFSPLEAEGARLFARYCEGCHQARSVADDPGTRVVLGPAGELEPWQSMIFSDSAPLLWASDAYAQTGVVPWMHAQGTRVPSLRRLYTDWPYYTNGRARSLDAVLAGVRLDGQGGCDHELEPVDDGGLDEQARAALLAFLRLL